jgi:biopolymer transport protein ExbD
MNAIEDAKVDLHSDLPKLTGSGRRQDVEMDITPMIDMTFLLLIFFLVCSTPDQATSIELAKARYGKGVGERNSVIITISDEGVDSAPVYLADGMIGDPLPNDPEEQSDMIVAAVETGRRDQNKENVLIKADRNVAHREVARVIKAVSRIEGAKIYLAVLEAD